MLNPLPLTRRRAARRLRYLIVASIALFQPTAASALSLTASINGIPILTVDCGTAGVVCTEKNGVTVLLIETKISSDPLETNLVDRVTFEAGTKLDPDPEIFYGASAFDFGPASSFSFTFEQAIVPTTGRGTASNDYSGSTTDGGADGVTVTPAAPPAGVPVDSDGNPEMSVYTLSLTGDPDLINAGYDLGEVFNGAASTSDNQGPFVAQGKGPVAAAGLVYDLMRVDVSFMLSGNNDSYSFNGHATIIPEPSTALLLLVGLVVMASTRRQRLAAPVSRRTHGWGHVA